LRHALGLPRASSSPMPPSLRHNISPRIILLFWIPENITCNNEVRTHLVAEYSLSIFSASSVKWSMWSEMWVCFHVSIETNLCVFASWLLCSDSVYICRCGRFPVWRFVNLFGKQTD
jgi:hypothetical protein